MLSNLLIVAIQVLTLFALMGVGAVARKLKWVEDAGIKSIVNILVIVVTPCLVIDAFQRPFDPAMMKHLGLAFFAVVVIHFIAIALAVLLVRPVGTTPRGVRANTTGILQVAAAFSNAGFMGLPLEYAILGPEGVFFGVVYVAVFNVFIWSWGMMRIRGRDSVGPVRDADTLVRENKTSDLIKIIFNPGFVGLALGLPWFLLSIILPPVIRTPVKMLADLNTPLAMIVIGFYLAGANLKPLFRNRAAYMSALTRLIIFPLVIIGGFYPFRTYFNPNMMLAFAIAACAPAAALTSMMAAKFGRDVDTAVGIVSGTTLLSMLTMPPMIALAMEVLKS